MFGWLPLLMVLVGVLQARHVFHHGNIGGPAPMITASQQQRICADLCTVGLGGEPCGDVCYDLMPQGMPHQSPKDAKVVQSARSRTDVCPILCENRLGYPLCPCSTAPLNSTAAVNTVVRFDEICEFYCERHSWYLRGCPVCNHTKGKQNGRQQQDGVAEPRSLRMSTYQASDSNIDWERWCNVQCANSNGGSACNCDLLPFALKTK